MRRPLLNGISILILALSIGLLAGQSSGHAAVKPTEREPPEELTSENWPQLAPRLYGEGSDWINTNGNPLKIKKGTVYVIDFWEYTCVNCLRTLPYLKEWNRRYAKYGLVIIGIHTPEFQFAHDHNNVAAAVKRLGIDWPVLVDSDYKNWNAFHNNFWPRHYFIDIRGNIVDDHAGEGGYEESEGMIQRLLKQAHPNLKFPKVMDLVRGEDKPGARCYPMTPELYAGERGSMNGQLGNIDNFAVGQEGQFTAPAEEPTDGRIYAVGRWKMEPESLLHAHASADRDDKILLRYHAIEANAVIKPESGEPIKVAITQDGHPVKATDKGDDIRYEANGDSYILVDQPRMYKLIKNAQFGSHLITLATRSAGFGLYSFTFTSCEEK